MEENQGDSNQRSNLFSTWKQAMESKRNDVHLIVADDLLQNPHIDPSADNQWAIRWASEYGHLSVVDRLLQDQRVDPSTMNQWAIGWASRNGHLSVVNRLLLDSRVDPSVNQWAIQWAGWHGCPLVVDRLLQDERVDPSVDHQSTIGWARYLGHVETIRLLLSDSRLKPISFE